MKPRHMTLPARIILLVTVILLVHIDGLAQSATTLTAHYAEIVPGADGISYTVSLFLSALDSGNPINGLEADDFSIQEDGQKVEIQDLRQLTEEPVNVVLVMDTSKVMSETDINNVKSAAVTFISRLKPNDRLALITFDTSAKNQTDELTTDHQKIADIITNKIFPTREAGTCLYDAAYSALKMFAAQPAGTRAVILLTNGKDEKTRGEKCSDHSSDEVLTMASEGELRAPLYLIGLEVDEVSDNGRINFETLRNLAERTGGMYVNLSSSSKVNNIFDSLSTQFRGQYILTYSSTSMPGDHHVIVSLNLSSLSTPSNRDTRKINLPPLPPRLVFTSPQEKEIIGDVLKIAITLTTQGEASVERVAFEVNGLKVGEDDTKPYEIELDARSYPAGLMTISVAAYGPNNTEIVRSSINASHAGPAETVIAIPFPEGLLPTPTPVPTAPPADHNTSVVIMAVALSTLSILVIGILLFLLLRRQKHVTIRDLEKILDGDNTLQTMQGIPVLHKIEAGRKTPPSDDEPQALGALSIEASDDPTLVGYRFIITAPLVSLGRNADNDICFPADKPVSRHHAEIYQISGNMYLREVQTADAAGMARSPKYGTFVNQAPVGSDPIQLKTGDEIQLGKRVRLKFESYAQDREGDALTYDEQEDDDRTATDDIDQTAIQE